MDAQHLAPELRKQLVRLPAPFDAHFGIIPLPPKEDAVELGAARAVHATALESIGKADGLAKAYPDHFFLSRILVRQEAVASSAIEGTYSTLDHLLEVEEADPTDQKRADASARQVGSYAAALERALGDVERNRHDAFSVGLIRDLQREVVKDDPDYKIEPGMLRPPGHIVHIGGGPDIARSIYNPTPPENIDQCLNDQISYLRCAGLQKANQSVITRMAISHAHFEAIHPFPNGNGRTGRLLLPLMLAADGHTPLYLAPYIAANRPAYMDALRAAQQRLQFVPLIEVLSRATIHAVDTVEATHGDLFAVFALWSSRRKWRKNSAAKRALDLLTGYPVITPARLAAQLAISVQAGHAAIKQLVKVDILTERTGFKRNRVFVAREVLRIYNRPA